MTSLKTVLNWEVSFKYKLEKELTSGKVVKVECVMSFVLNTKAELKTSKGSVQVESLGHHQ